MYVALYYTCGYHYIIINISLHIKMFSTLGERIITVIHQKFNKQTELLCRQIGNSMYICMSNRMTVEKPPSMRHLVSILHHYTYKHILTHP